jgi:hypothetical protein
VDLKATFYLPLRDNDGTDLTAARDRVFRAVFDAFGHWTKAGTVRGAYRRPDGETTVDDFQVSSVVLAPERLPELERVFREFREGTTQESVYLEITPGVEVRLVR